MPLLALILPVVRRVVAGAFVGGSVMYARIVVLPWWKFETPCQPHPRELESSKQIFFDFIFFTSSFSNNTKTNVFVKVSFFLEYLRHILNEYLLN